MVVDMGSEVKMGTARVYELDAPLSLVLLTFHRGPLYKSFSSGRPASVSMPNDHSCERVRSHGTSSLALVAF